MGIGYTTHVREEFPEPFSAELERLEDVPVVRARGELDLASSPSFVEALEGARNTTPHLHCVVDMREVAFMDSVGLNVLLEHRNQLRYTGAELRLVVHADEDWPVKRLLELTGLEESFRLYTDCETAATEA